MRVVFFTFALTLLASAAHADVPAWTEEAAFESFCATLVKGVGCPDCACEAITQSTPTEDAGEISDIPSAVVVKVGGVKEDGMIVAQYRVVMGSEGKLVDGGAIGDASGHMGNPRETSVAILGSEQRFDMCPGMCPHDPVGMIHAFEVKTTWTEPSDKDEAVSTLGSRTDLALCFAPDGKKAGCWLLPIAGGSGTVKTDPAGEGADVVKEKSVWSRSWKLSDSGEVQLRLGKPKGRVPAELRRAAKTPAKQHLKDIPGRPDAKPASR